ncbi:MAG TPA: maleylpyruvate isomerase family mycothiol-dependent enzyme [Acidimicrobiales bacterium]|nr:maleylpyruvate isomerase family mycothiol-dependent enzyme [Acidimicrobiales bacterium]
MPTPDDHELTEINPYDLMESEAARLEFYFGSLRGDDWDEASACEGWSVKDVLAHLAGGEEYNRACLTDSVSTMFERYAARGATDVHSFNALGVSDRKQRTPADLLDEFQRENGATRADMRRRDGEQMPTAVGPYPVRWQAWHLASELATHADDVGVPTTHKREEETRRDWRVRFARFALAEMKPDVEVQVLGDGTWVRANGVEATLTDDQLIDAVNARLPADSPVNPTLREALAALG